MIPPTRSAPWMAIAERYRDLPELVDGELNPAVCEMFRHTRFPPAMVSRNTAWCGAFACTCLEQSGIRSPRSARARDFLLWGVGLEAAVYGAILVFSRGSTHQSDTRGHVTFCYATPGVDACAQLLCYGGNQSNTVCARPHATRNLLGVRWPKDVPLPADARLKGMTRQA